MPKHPEDTPSEFHEESEDWTPEKEKKQDPSKLMERAMAMMDRQEAQVEEATAARTVNALDYMYPANRQQIAIRRIKNGFIMTYFEAKEVPRGPALVNVPGVLFPKEVEVFMASATDAQPLLVEALKNAELLEKSAAIIEKVAAEQMRMAQSLRRPGAVVPFPRAVGPFDPPPAAAPPPATPDEETRKLEDPPPASPA